MKITPIEIRQHTFDKSLRGYKVDDVDAFLSSLSQEWERVVGDSKMLKMQLELAEKELNKLKEIELTLFRTLKNAEDNSSQIAEQANRQAEQYMAEMRLKADEQLNAARKKSAVMIQDAESQSRYVRENLSVELKSLEQDFKAMERYKDNLMVQIRALATNAMESVDRFEKKFAKQSARQKFEETNNDQAASDLPADASAAATPVVETPAQEQAEPAADLPTAIATHELTPDDLPAQEVAAPELPADAEVPADLPTNAQTTSEPTALAGADAAVQYAAEQAQPAEPAATPAESEPRKGGSFFDQI